MLDRLLFVAVLLLMSVACLSTAVQAAPADRLVPMPAQLRATAGSVAWDEQGRVFYDTREASRPIEQSLRPLAEVVALELELLTGHRPEVVALSGEAKPTANDVVLRFDRPKRFAPTEPEEDQAYRLTIGRSGIEVVAEYYKGVAYGTATLVQLLEEEDGEAFRFPQVRIDDRPAAAYRGVMIDVAREYHSVGTLKEVVRMARMYKIRYLQLHLTDDQNFTYPFPPITDSLENNYTFTRQELIDLVAYADARGVTLIPELDLPGHSSKLQASGYLVDSNGHAAVADEVNHDKIAALIDDMLTVFHSSPYFHIGGDESGAGDKLVPFLQRINQHLRSKPEDERRRMLVWEGFHGAPLEQLPATGPDRIIVHAWESAYNAPWDLLDYGYTLINSSWKPLYVVGNGRVWHPGQAIRQWSPQTLYAWDKDTFMHWDPYRPLFQDADPDPDGDRDRTDHQWSAAENKQADQVLGGQLIFWEQKEQTVIPDMRDRLPVVAERLWNPDTEQSFEQFEQRAQAADRVVMTLVRPVEVLPSPGDDAGPIAAIYRPYTGDSATITLRNRTKVKGQIRYTLGGFSDSITYFIFADIPPIDAQSMLYEGPFEQRGGFGIRAQLFREDGTPVEGSTWVSYNNWPNRVRVTEYDIDEQQLEEVPDLARLPERRVLRQYELPVLRGPLNHIDIIGQMFEATLVAPESGEYTLTGRGVNGRLTIYLDTDRDGRFAGDERVLTNIPPSDDGQSTTVQLEKGERYALRVDHAAAMYGPIVWLHLEGPGTNGKQDITGYLEPLGRE